MHDAFADMSFRLEADFFDNTIICMGKDYIEIQCFASLSLKTRHHSPLRLTIKRLKNRKI